MSRPRFLSPVVSLPALALGAGLLSAMAAAAQAPPETFTRTLTTGTESLVVEFALHPIRTGNFRVHVQQADGTFIDHEADVPRTYLGRVPSLPGAVAIGLLRADGTLMARVGLENGMTWTTTGGNASVSGNAFVPEWPTTVVGAGGAGSQVYMAEVGIDSTFNHFTACGGTPAAVLEQCEFSVMSANMVYLRDSAILHRIGRVVIRADQAQDPYAPDGGDTGDLLTRVRSVWNAGTPMGSAHDLGLVLHSGANGGLAYVGTVGNSNRYSANDSDSRGDFSVVWRHEAGHNWSSSHYEGGGNPEGDTIMSNNGLSRFSSSENRKIISHRNTKTSILDNLGSYTFPLPPRANQDTASWLLKTPERVDVMANDSDSNGQALALHSFDAASARGGVLSRSAGTGPGGRDEVLYTPPPNLSSGTDWFSYRIQDAGGQQAVGYVMLRPRRDVLEWTDHWTLDDTLGSTTAVNSRRTSRDGTHQNGTVAGQTGARAVTRRGAFYDGVNDRTSIAAPGYSTNVLTFTAWVKRNGNQNANAALIFSRAGSSIAGLHFGSANELRYTWDGNGSTWAPSPALTVPDDTWCLAAMSVSPSGVTLHLRTPGGLQSATHAATLAAEAFNGLMYLGQDTGGSTRCLKGWLDDVRVYKATLSAGDIESLYQQATVPPVPVLTQPAAGSSQAPLSVVFSASVGSGGDIVDAMEFVEEDTVHARADGFPWQATTPELSPGSRQVVARAYFGDWSYSVDSAPVTFTALEAPLPAVRVLASLPASKRGPVTGTFTFTRDHGIGSLTIPFTVGGTAVPGTDYTALAAGTVVFPAGVLTQTIEVQPISGPPDSPAKTVTVTPTAGAGWTLPTPLTATLRLDDHITSVATGAWSAAETWNSEAPAPVTGTQNTGTGYAIAAHTVTSNNTDSSTQALVAGSLRVKSGGVLDLARLHNGGLTNATYNLPATAVESGGTIQFRASTGSSAHTVAAALAFSGDTVLRIKGGGYENYATLSGAVSGNGTIAVISDTNAGGGTGYVRRVSLTAANNPYSGNWSVSHLDSGDDFGGLRAGASNALGTGTVRLGHRSQLINDNATGLNSLAGVVLEGNNASLRLNQRWANPAATLSLRNPTAVAQLGNAASEIGSLSGTDGTIQGTGASSSLTVHQSLDGRFLGVLGENLAFTKRGAAFLGLEGNLHPALRLTLAAGTLGVGPAPVSVASLTQSGGTLSLALPEGGQPALHLSGNAGFTNATVKVVLPPGGPVLGTAYPLIRWQGTRTGLPTVQADTPLVLTVDAGAANASVLRVTFSQPAALTVLTVNASPASGGTVSGGGDYPVGSTRQITAVAAADWQFAGWTGAGVADPASPSTTVTMEADRSVTATFVSLYDLWAQGHGLTGPAAARAADPDGDGLTNEIERAFGFIPNDPNSSLKLGIVSVADGSLRLVVNKMIPSGTFVLQWTTSLTGAWGGNSTVPSPTAAAENVLLVPPGPPGRCFYRLVYTAPPS